MLRLRRYRTFLIFAIIAVFALYRFRSTPWATESPFRPNHPTGQGHVVASAPREPTREPTKEPRPYVAAIPEAESTQEQVLPPSIPPINKPTQAIAHPTQAPAGGPPDEAPPANSTATE